MKPIEFKEVTVIFAKNQPEYQPLPTFVTGEGTVISCWRLSFWERIKILFLGKLWLAQMTLHDRLQPQLPSVHKSDMMRLE